MKIEKMQVSDSVTAVLGNATHKDWSRTLREKLMPRANVHVVLRDAEGNVKYDEWGENLVTDVGDGFIAARLYDNTENIVTGMKLGTGATAAAKNGTGAASIEVGTYISGSNEALDATATDATKGAGLGWRTEYVCTWIAGDVTNSTINEVALTNQTALTDSACAVADCIARFVFGATIDKQAGDSLEVTWQIDILGA